MKSIEIHNKIDFIDTLLSFDGIIPSLPDFQLKLVTLIEQFHQTLITGGSNNKESDNLCRIICFYLDKKINSRLDRNFSSWDGFLLENYFFGYDKEKYSIYDKINSLMQTCDNTIYIYSYKLLSDLVDIIGYDEEITALLSKYSNQRISPYLLNEITTPQELIADNETVIINTSKKEKSWKIKALLQASISITIVFIVWLYCNYYINSFQ